MSAKSAHQRWHEWRLRVVSDSNQHENVKQRQREQKRKERASFKEQASNAQLEAKRAADRERQRRRRARLRAAKEVESTLVGNVPAVGACGKPRVVPHTTSQRAHSHSKSSTRPSMKISVNGLISAKKGHRFPEHRSTGTEHTESHTWDNLNGHGNPTPGITDTAVSDVLQESPLRMDTKFISDRYSTAKNNNLSSFSPSAVPSNAQPFPVQDQPLCLKKTTPRLTQVIDRDFKRTLISPSEHMKKMNSYSPNSWDALNLGSRKRSRKQSQPLKYVALN